MKKIYYIGGSPCSGKSTIAQFLSKKYGLYYFKADDYLEKYTDMGAGLSFEICMKQKHMSAEQIWMRKPDLQCREEFLFYEEIFGFILQDLETVCNKTDLITEGAAYLPKLMNQIGISFNEYLSITPSKNFQIGHYIHREWVQDVLSGCTDRKKAFENWMERDCLFAREVEQQCAEYGFLSFVNNGDRSIGTLSQMAARHFGFEEPYGKKSAHIVG